MKRRKAKKHPSAPKHPMSAYLYFVADHRQKLKQRFPEKGFTEIARMLGDEWRKLDLDSKQVRHACPLVSRVWVWVCFGVLGCASVCFGVLEN